LLEDLPDIEDSPSLIRLSQRRQPGAVVMLKLMNWNLNKPALDAYS
jgi:hypothetical protein